MLRQQKEPAHAVFFRFSAVFTAKNGKMPEKRLFSPKNVL
jgi:hypothetical protein